MDLSSTPLEDHENDPGMIRSHRDCSENTDGSTLTSLVHSASIPVATWYAATRKFQWPCRTLDLAWWKWVGNLDAELNIVASRTKTVRHGSHCHP